jgi:radical SAM superfamily enzyme YgiQ (UPF0313 family)
MKPDITLIFPSSPFLINEQVFPPLGILYLAGLLRDWGYKPQVIDLAACDLQDPVKVEADIVGISLTTPQRDQAYRIAKQLKKEGKVLIAGGAHATHMPDECVKNGFDFVVRGEGEMPLLSLMLYLTSDMRPESKIVGSASDCVSPDRLALPARDLIDLKKYRYRIEGRQATTIMTSRGCPYNCSFCARVTRKFRYAKAETVMKEIGHLRKTYDYRAFMIFDDVFIASKKRNRRLARLLEGQDLKFRCFVRSNLIDDENVRLMKRMGVVEVGIGVESGSNEILKRNLKGTTREGNLEAIKILRKHGIRTKAFLIVGLPGESRDTIRETIGWIESARPDDIDFTIFQPLPGSPVFERPDFWNIKFEYNSKPMWYKGTPGYYECSVSTEHLYSEELVAIRDELEDRYKKKELLR